MEHYELVLCGTCKHPAGQHLYGGGCRLDGCICSGYIEGGTGRWSDDLTDRLGGFRIEIDDEVGTDFGPSLEGAKPEPSA